MMEREFTVDEARALMPEVLARAAEIVRLRADLTELTYELRATGSSALGGVPEAKAHEARLQEQVSWLTEQGMEIKGLAPFLVDFPAHVGGRSVRLCWIEGESRLEWYHRTELGFAGRRPLD